MRNQKLRTEPKPWRRFEVMWTWASGLEASDALVRRLQELDSAYRAVTGASAGLPLPFDTVTKKLTAHRKGAWGSRWTPLTAKPLVGVVLGLDDSSPPQPIEPQEFFQSELPEIAARTLALDLVARQRLANRWVSYLCEETHQAPSELASPAEARQQSWPAGTDEAPTPVPAPAPEPTYDVPTVGPPRGSWGVRAVLVGVLALAIGSGVVLWLASDRSVAAEAGDAADAPVDGGGHGPVDPVPGTLPPGAVTAAAEASGALLDGGAARNSAAAASASAAPEPQATVAFALRGQREGRLWDLQQHKRVRSGDVLVVEAVAREPVYLTMLLIDDAGALHRVYPEHGSARLFPGATQRVPPETEGQLTVDSRPGTERLLLLTTTRPVRGGDSALAMLVRSLYDDPKWPSAWPRSGGRGRVRQQGTGARPAPQATVTRRGIHRGFHLVVGAQAPKATVVDAEFITIQHD